MHGRSQRGTIVESGILACIGLTLYLPFRAIQFDLNGVAEAAALEAGQLLHKNHLLYRPIGFLIYRGLEYFGYAGNSLSILQILNAVCGAVGVGLAYSVFKHKTNERATAAFGSLWLGTSLIYWMYSTDAAYVVLSAAFALAALACVSYGSSMRWMVSAAAFTSLSILTWQASIFLVPSLLLLLLIEHKRAKEIATFVAGVALIAGTCYLVVAVATDGVTGPIQLWRWFTSYGESNTLSMWGVWDATRIDSASMSALGSLLPVRLAVWPSEITKATQLGRVAIDFALLGLSLLALLAVLKIRPIALWFLASYLLFIPFIVWWDPFEPKWFLIPNLFLAGFFSCGLSPWLHRKYINVILVGCALTVAGANFVTIINPRHNKLGIDRATAQCVAGHMQAQDAFIAAEWGWPDYLNYLHARTELNLINETAYAGSKDKMLPAVKGFIAMTQRKGGSVYMEDPRKYPESHLSWLRSQTGLSLDELVSFGGMPAFECSDRTIQKLPLTNNP